jgi:DNA polymerase-1
MQAKMVLQVHDELVFEVPQAEHEAAAALVKREMEGVTQLRVPLVVSLGAGRHWAEAKG